MFQSRFKTRYNTELALLRVFNDILLATDSGHCVVLVLLKVTVTFDTVGHEILWSRMMNWVDTQGGALEGFWF